jgi:hypothetical protein
MMRRFIIDLPDKAVDALQTHVQRTNDSTGADLTLKAWIILHLKEIAIAPTLQQAVTDAAVATRQQLLSDLDSP